MATGIPVETPQDNRAAFVALRAAIGMGLVDLSARWTQGQITNRLDYSAYDAGTNLEAIAPWVLASGTAGTMRVGSTAGRLTQAVNTTALYTIDTGNVAHWIEADVYAQSNSFPLAICAIDVNNYIGVRYSSTTGFIELVQAVAGVFTTLWTEAPSTSATRYRLEARADKTYALYLDNVLLAKGAINVALQAATKVGIATRPTGSNANFVGGHYTFSGAEIHGVAGGTCWFNGPRAICANGKTFVCSTRGKRPKPSGVHAGYTEVSQIDNATGAVSTYTLASGSFWEDDHAVGGLAIRTDGRLVCFYSQHLDTAGIKYRISVNPYDATAWSAENVVPGTVYTNSLTTYCHPLFLSGESNKLYVFWRDESGNLAAMTSTDLNAATPASVDGGALGSTPTFSAKATWIPLPAGSAKGVYYQVKDNSVDRIDFAITNAVADTTGAKIDVRHCYWKSGALRGTDGTSLGSFPVAFSATTAVATSGAPDNLGHVWVWDVTYNDTTTVAQVVFARFVTPTDHRYYYARSVAGGAWSKTEIPNTSTLASVPATSTEQYYSPGVILDDAVEGLVYCAISTERGKSDLFRYKTSDGGISWGTPSKISPVAIDYDPVTQQNLRPIVPKNRAANVAVLFQRGRYAFYDFSGADNGYQTDLIWASVP